MKKISRCVFILKFNQTSAPSGFFFFFYRLTFNCRGFLWTSPKLHSNSQLFYSWAGMFPSLVKQEKAVKVLLISLIQSIASLFNFELLIGLSESANKFPEIKQHHDISFSNTNPTVYPWTIQQPNKLTIINSKISNAPSKPWHMIQNAHFYKSTLGLRIYYHPKCSSLKVTQGYTNYTSHMIRPFKYKDIGHSRTFTIYIYI